MLTSIFMLVQFFLTIFIIAKSITRSFNHWVQLFRVCFSILSSEFSRCYRHPYLLFNFFFKLLFDPLLYLAYHQNLSSTRYDGFLFILHVAAQTNQYKQHLLIINFSRQINAFLSLLIFWYCTSITDRLLLILQNESEGSFFCMLTSHFVFVKIFFFKQYPSSINVSLDHQYKKFEFLLDQLYFFFAINLFRKHLNTIVFTTGSVSPIFFHIKVFQYTHSIKVVTYRPMTYNIPLLTLVFIFISLLTTLNASYPQNKPLIGGYQKLNFSSESDLKMFSMFSQADQLCRKQYIKQWGTELGSILRVDRQVVSGINYKIVYETQCKCNEVYFVVYTQSWTNKISIIDVGNMPTINQSQP